VRQTEFLILKEGDSFTLAQTRRVESSTAFPTGREKARRQAEDSVDRE